MTRPPEDHDRMLQRLATAQRRKLVTNDHKGLWLAMTPMQMLARLEEEVEELRQAMAVAWPGHAEAAVNNEALRAIRDEAADVANFAGFIVDAVAEMSSEKPASFRDYAFPDDDLGPMLPAAEGVKHVATRVPGLLPNGGLVELDDDDSDDVEGVPV